MRDVDKLRQRRLDRQTITDRDTDLWWFRLRAQVVAKGWHFELLTSWNVLLLHHIIGPYVFILYMMFHLMLETIMMFKLMRHNWHWLWHVHACCILKQHYKDTVQERSTILISCCCKFTRVHMCQKLSKKISVWQSYCKNKMVFFYSWWI